MFLQRIYLTLSDLLKDRSRAPLRCVFLKQGQFVNKNVELFSWKTTSHQDHLKVCLRISRLLSGLHGMWSSMKITLVRMSCPNMSLF